jgi:hypothetical protein
MRTSFGLLKLVTAFADNLTMADILRWSAGVKAPTTHVALVSDCPSTYWDSG